MNKLGVFHFDLHLKNVMIQYEKENIKDVYIIDFGKATKDILESSLNGNDYLDQLQKAYKSSYVDRLGIFEFLFVWLKDPNSNDYLNKVINFIKDKIYTDIIYSNYTSLQKTSWELDLDDYVDTLRDDLGDFLKYYFKKQKCKELIEKLI